MVVEPTTVEHDQRYTGGLGPLGDQLAHLGGGRHRGPALAAQTGPRGGCRCQGRPGTVGESGGESIIVLSPVCGAPRVAVRVREQGVLISVLGPTALRAVTGDPAMRARAAALGGTIRAEDGISRAIVAIEAYVSGKPASAGRAPTIPVVAA